MTQQLPGAAPGEIVELTEPDPFETLYQDIQSQRERLRRIPATAENAMAQMDGTVLSLMSDLCVAMTRSRDGQQQQLDEMDERVETAEAAAFRAGSGLTQIEHEDAEKLDALIETCRELIQSIRGGAQQPAEVLQSLKLAEELAADCAEIVKENRLDPEDDDEDEDDEEEEELQVAQNGSARGQA